MEKELKALRRRIAVLEAALAGLVVGWIAFAALGGTTVAAQPSNVVAPFKVVDAKGKPLLTVQANDEGGGALFVFDATGDVTAAVGASKGVAAFRALRAGNTRLSMGVSQSNDGLIEVLGPMSRNILILPGSIKLAGDAGKTIAEIGQDTRGHGFLTTRNKAGGEMSTVAASDDGTSGRVFVATADGIVARMGALVNGKGDVCALGAPGKTVCLSGLAAKTLTPF